LTTSTATSFANVLVSCRYDYCNSLFTSISNVNFARLQYIQNSLARVVRRKLKYDHITPSLKLLHWLPVRYHCNFKVLTLVYKYLSLRSPAYFGQVLKPRVSSVNTRSSNPIKRILTVPKFKTREISFVSKCCSLWELNRLWNSLQIELRTAQSLYTFRRKLKTHLFAKSYPP
jgi:hypothetical protein